MTPCPPLAELEKLLAEPDETTTAPALEAHLGECAQCQQALAGLNDNQEWRHLRGLLSDDGESHTDLLQSVAAPSPDAQVTKRLRVDPPADFLAGLKSRLPQELSRKKQPKESRSPAWPKIPGYEILGELGKGGAAVVYRARHLSLGRLVALKILSGRHAMEEALARLNVEAGVVAQLRHANIVQIYEIGESDGLPYLSLEYVAGGTLAQFLAGVPQDPRASARFLEQVALAVHHAHEAGIIHRDLKPGNILLDLPRAPESASATLTNFLPKVTDFGLARRLEEVDQHLTETGAVIGTPRYMAPEQARPANGKTTVTPATDVHALGVILYEMLTGRPPFAAATTVDTLLQILHEDPVSPGRLCARLPRELEAITLKCLHKDPGRRYRSALELAHDLRRFLNGEPVHARPVGDAQRLARWARRNPAIAGLLCGIVAIAVAAFVGISLALVEARDAQRQEAQERAHAESARADTQKALERSERSVYFGNIAQARSQWLLNNVRGATQLLDQCPPERRGWEWHYLDRLNHRDLLTLPDLAPYVSGVAFAPGQPWLAIGGGNPFAAKNRGLVRCVHADTGATRWSRDDLTYRVNTIAFSPDGRRVVSGGGNFFPDRPGELKIFNADSGHLLHELEGHKHDINGLAFTADGRRLASASSDRTVRIWELDPVREVMLLKHDNVVLCVAFSPDQRWVFAAEPEKMSVWNAETSELVTSFPTLGSQMALSPDGKKLAFESRGGVSVAEVDSLTASSQGSSQPRILHHLAGPTSSILGLAFHADGKQLATASADSTVRVWDLESGQEKRILRGHHGRVSCVAYHPDGKRLASGGHQPGDVKVWDVAQPVEYTTALSFAEEKADIFALAFLPHGQRLAGLGVSGSLRIRDLCDAEKADKLEIDVSQEWLVPATVAVFSDDGERIVAAAHSDARVIKVWQTRTAKELAVLRGHQVKVWHVACDRNAELIASAAHDKKAGGFQNELILADPMQGRTLFKDVTSRRRTTALALGLDGKLLVEACEHASPASAAAHEVRLWSAAQDAWTHITLPGPDRRVFALALTRDGRYLAASYSDGTVAIWDLATRKLLHARPIQAAEGIEALAFHPTGTRLAGAGRNRTQVWDVISGQHLLFLRGAPPRHFDNGFNPRVVWSQDGSLLANSNWDRTVSVWPPLQEPSAKVE